MLGNILGMVLQPLGYLLLFLLSSSHSLPTWLLALPSLPPALVGMDAVNIITIYSYAGDVSHGTSARSTSVRFIIVATLWNLATPVGIFGGNLLLERGGFLWLFSVVSGLYGLAALYTGVAVTNIIPHRTEEEEEVKEDVNINTRSACSKLIRLLRGLFSNVTRRRKDNGRIVINLLIVILGTCAITYTADSNITFVFLQVKFGFDQMDFSNLQSIRYLLTGGGALLLVAIIQLTDINVLVIGLISCLSKLGYYLE